jgi:hypothetical protein
MSFDTYMYPGGNVIFCKCFVYSIKIVGVQSRNKCSLWNVERKE